MTKKQLANRFSNKNPLRIVFAGELNLSMGSDRIFSYNFCNNLSKIDNVYAVLRNEYSESDVDVLILKKSFALEKLIEIRKSNKDLLIGIINPSDKKRGILENVDFAIVGSVEERAYYSKYLKCFIYPLIEHIPNSLIKSYEEREENLICYHGNKQHLEMLNPNIENALIKLVKEGYKFKAIYDFNSLGKIRKKFITHHVQWKKESWLEEISNASVGITPVSLFGGKLKEKLAKYIYLRNKDRNAFLFQYKNTINASRAFVFHQLKIPVVSEIGGSFHHIMGDQTAGHLCSSENSWYESLTFMCKNKAKAKAISEKAFMLMEKLYNPVVWCERFIEELRDWSISYKV